MSSLLRIIVASLVINIAVTEDKPLGDVCEAESDNALCSVLQDGYGSNDGDKIAYLEFIQSKARKFPSSTETVYLEKNATVESQSIPDGDVVGDFSPKKTALKSDIKNVMPLTEAQRLDEAAIKEYPDMIPQVPIMFPDTLEWYDAAIVPKLQGLDRNSKIRITNQTEVPYWQTLQYAHRNFRFLITRFQEGAVRKKFFDTFTEAQKIRTWAINGLMRKILCTDAFRNWVMASNFSDGATPDSVYPSFEYANKATYISMYDIEGPRIDAYANAIGVVFDRYFFSKASDSFLLGVYTHEQSHNLGYHHKSLVPNPIKKFMADRKSVV